MIILPPPVTSPPPLLPRDCHRISGGGRTAKGRWSSRVRATVRKVTPRHPNQHRRAPAGLRHLRCSSPAPGKLHPCVASRAAPRRHYRPRCWHRRRLLRVGHCTLPPCVHSLASEHLVPARNGGCEPLRADGDARHGPRARPAGQRDCSGKAVAAPSLGGRAPCAASWQRARVSSPTL
jgi:hypothetical protein